VLLCLQLKIKTKVNGLNSKKEFPVVMMGNTTGTSAVVLLGEESTGHVIARVRTSPNATASLSGVKVRTLLVFGTASLSFHKRASASWLGAA
jgi:hypothetical protein